MIISINPLIIKVKALQLEVPCVVVAICVLLTDVKLFDIKISELFMLTYLILNIRYVPKSFNLLILFFVFFFIVSVLNTYIIEIASLSGISNLLKRPYFISISRFAEYLSCIGFILYIYKNLFIKNQKIRVVFLIKRLCMYSLLFAFIFIIEYIIIKIKLIDIEHSIFYYGETRLKGFYVEGGPLGLSYAFIISLVYLYEDKNKLLKLSILLLIVILSQSKAGFFYLLIFAGSVFYNEVKLPKYIYPFFILLLILISIIALNYIAKGYIYEVSNVANNIQFKQDDPNYVMGRIAALFIVPNIVMNNYIFGIGMGNYPLVRNNPLYRGIFPEVELWDSTGLGGIVDMLVDGGFVFILLFGLLVWKVYNSSKSLLKKYLFIAYLLPFILGVQLHFMYPWLAIGILFVENLATSKNEI